MKMKSLAIAAACALAASAGGANSQDLAKPIDSSYTCNFLPLSGINPGRIYRVKKMPRAGDFSSEKPFTVTNRFEVSYMEGPEISKAADYVSGFEYSSVSKVDGKIAIEATGLATEKTGASLNKKVTLKRAIANHWRLEVTDEDVMPAKEWMRQLTRERGWTYFLVREVRFAKAITYSLDKNSAAALGVKTAPVTSATPASADASLSFGRDSSLSLAKSYEQPLVFCTLVERL